MNKALLVLTLVLIPAISSGLDYGLSYGNPVGAAIDSYTKLREVDRQEREFEHRKAMDEMYMQEQRELERLRREAPTKLKTDAAKTQPSQLLPVGIDGHSVNTISPEEKLALLITGTPDRKYDSYLEKNFGWHLISSWQEGDSYKYRYVNNKYIYHSDGLLGFQELHQQFPLTQ